MRETPITVGVYIANLEATQEIKSKLKPLLAGYRIEFIPIADDPELILTLPEFIKQFAANQLVIALSDDLSHITDYDNVVEVSPYPINPDDYERLAWRVLRIAVEIDDDS